MKLDDKDIKELQDSVAKDLAEIASKISESTGEEVTAETIQGGLDAGIRTQALYATVIALGELKEVRTHISDSVEMLVHAYEHPDCVPKPVHDIAKLNLKKSMMALICLDFLPHLERGEFEKVNAAMSAAMATFNKEEFPDDPSEIIH